MRDNEDREQFSFLAAATTRPGVSGFADDAMAKKNSGAGGEYANPQNGKKPYAKPGYRYERVFETLALTCGKQGPVEFQCRFNRRNS
jgi:hypothetical protein